VFDAWSAWRMLEDKRERGALDLVADEVQAVLLDKAAVRDERVARVAEPQGVVRVAHDDGADAPAPCRALCVRALDAFERRGGRLGARRERDPDDLDAAAAPEARCEARVRREGEEDDVARVGEDRRERVEDGRAAAAAEEVGRLDGAVRRKVGREEVSQGGKEAVRAREGRAVLQGGHATCKVSRDSEGRESRGSHGKVGVVERQVALEKVGKPLGAQALHGGHRDRRDADQPTGVAEDTRP